MPQVGVLGGGISGLMASFRLRQHGLSVQLLEATDRVGGVIQTTRADGFLVEHGPNSLRPTDPLEAVIDTLDLADDRVWANEAAQTRYVVQEGRPVALPTSIGSFLSTPLFSLRAKLRLLAEPFIPARSATDESLADFARRRLGSEVLDYAVAPFVGGVFAGDPERLSARHAFERLVTMEQEHGSLFWGALRSSGSSPAPNDAPSSLFSFRGGLETLPSALAESLDDQIQRRAPATTLRPNENGWTVEIDAPDGPHEQSFEALISTVPLHALRQLTLETPVDCSSLQEASYPPVSVVALGFERSAVNHPLDGFGLLVPPVEASFDILGTIFSSTLFPGRAPTNRVLLTTFLGGVRAPTLAERSPSNRQALVERDLDRLLGLETSPIFAKHVHWPRAIPQYGLDYGAVKDTLRTLEETHEGLFFAGNYRQGVSVGDALASGADAADRVARRIRAVS